MTTLLIDVINDYAKTIRPASTHCYYAGPSMHSPPDEVFPACENAATRSLQHIAYRPGGRGFVRYLIPCELFSIKPKPGERSARLWLPTTFEKVLIYHRYLGCEIIL